MNTIMKEGRVLNSEALNAQFIVSENNRKANEEQRELNEQQREDNEDERINNEISRLDNQNYWNVVLQELLNELENTDVTQLLDQIEVLRSGLSLKISYYNTINDLKLDSSLVSGIIVKTLGYHSINDGGGGNYYITDNSSLQNNEGTVHALNNGLKAILITDGVVNVKQFGAKGDGISDDTQSFKNAFNSRYNVMIPMQEGQHYKITDTIIAWTGKQRIYTDLGTGYTIMFVGGDDYNTFRVGVIDFDCADLTKPLFLATKTNINFDNIPMVSNPNQTRRRIGIKYLLEQSDFTNTDGIIKNCFFRNFEYGIHYTGRGLYVDGNYFLSCNHDIYIDMISDNSWINTPTLDNVLQTHPELYGRGFRITNNRFHVTNSTHIFVKGYETVHNSVTYHGTLNGAIISNNVADLGRGRFRFDCDLYGCIISDNVLNRVDNTSAISVGWNTRNCTFSENTIRGINNLYYPSANLAPAYGMYFTGFVSDTTFVGNTFENIQRSAIVVGDGSSFITISSNTFKRICFASDLSSTEKTIIRIGNCEGCSIVGNTFNPTVDSKIISCIKAHRSSSSGENEATVWTDFQILGNVYKNGFLLVQTSTSALNERNYIQGN